MLKERIFSAIILIIIVLVALLLFSPFYFALCVGVIVTLAVWEWTQFVQVKTGIFRFLISGLVGSFLFLWLFGDIQYLNAGRVFVDYAQPLLLASIIWWGIAFLFVITYPRTATIWNKSVILQIVFAFLTLIPFLIGVLSLRLDNYTEDHYHGVLLLLYVCILVWSADSGAYFVGRQFGKHKLAPKVSPGKTWQGAIGGLLTAGIIATIFIQFTSETLFSISTYSFILLSVFTVAISILGDLTESMFKREAGIKDSSQLIPGHGGVLDRIDSLVAAIPFFTYFYFYVL